MILIFSGPSAIGKDSTWIRISEKLGFNRYVPFTTREIRTQEKNGFDYNFITIQEFQEKIKNNEFFEWDYFANNYYGTDISILNLLNQSDIVFHALGKIALKLRNKLPQVKLVMLLPSDHSILVNRLHNRGYLDDNMFFRINHYFEEETHSNLFDFVVPNAESVTDYEAELLINKILFNKEI